MLTEAGLRHVLDWLKNINYGETASGNDEKLGRLAADEIERLLSAIATWKEEETCWKETETGLLARVEELEREIELHRKAQQAGPVICHHLAGQLVWSNCPKCGPNVALDDDNCCKSCGRDALWSREW